MAEKTMTAEEVEQSRKRLSQGLHKHLGDYDRDEHAALSRLAAQAARVPGLEKRLAEVEDAQKWERVAFEARRVRLLSAESERDAAEALVEEWKTASGLERGGDPDAVRPADLEADLAKREQEAATLRERVASLSEDLERAEKRLAAIDTGCSNCGGLPHTTTCRARDAVALLAYADTAEARVRELEGQLSATEREKRAVEEHVAKLSARLEDADEALAAADDQHRRAPEAVAAPVVVTSSGGGRIRARGVQPPPAPAQDVDACGACGKPLESSRTAVCQTCAPEREWFDQGAAVESVMSPATPTPPPGLREAVGVYLAARDTVDSAPCLEDVLRSRDAIAPAYRALRAAYDATGGRHAKTMAECSDVQGRAARDEAIAEDMEDAAKYRAAVARAKDKEGMARALYAAVRGKSMRWENATGMVQHDAEEAAVAVASHLLGLTLGTPPSETVDKPLHTWGVRGGRFAADDECPRPDPDDHWCKGECGDLTFDAPGGHEAWHREHARATATPPAGPGGGEGLEPGEDWGKHMTEAQMAAVMVEALREAQVVDSTRARIAPTPTPEVPPLKPAEESGDPAVVWEAPAVRVVRLSNNSVRAEVLSTPDTWIPSTSPVSQILARALAAAKRENTCDHGQPKEYCADSHNDAVDAAFRRGVESMRERAATAAKTARHRVLVTDESFGVYAMACEDIELSIRRLLLE